MAKIFNGRLLINMFKLDLEKAEEAEIKLPTSVGSLKTQESSRKTSTSALLTMPKPLTVWITTNCGKVFNRWEYQTTIPASWEICMQVKKQQFLNSSGSRSNRTRHETIDWFQIGKGAHQSCTLSPCLFNPYWEYIMQMPGWMKQKLESRLPGEISITTDMQMIPPLWQKGKNWRASWSK